MSVSAPLNPALPDIMRDTLAAGLLGFCIVDHEGCVLQRDGLLSQWAPPPGQPLFGHPVMESLRDAVFALRGAGGEIVLPGLGMQDAEGKLKLDIRFVWMEQGKFLLVTSSQAAGRTEMEAAVAQARREQHILEERLHARELQLAGQRRLMALFIRNVPAAIAMLDRELRYVAASDRWRSDFGLSEAATQVGAALGATLPGTSAQWQAGLTGSLEGVQNGCDLDTLTGAHGRSDYVRWRFLPWETGSAAGTEAPGGGVLLFCETITAQVEQARKLEEQAVRLRSANVDMKNFSLALSHDLQAPLRQMVKFAQLLDGEPGVAQVGPGRDFLDEIHGAGGRMQRMIDGLVRYLRVAARKPALRRIDLGDAVVAAQANLRTDFLAARARLDAGALPQVLGDLELLTLLFQNLLQNSLKFAGTADSVVDIAAQQHGTSWQIVYRDNGPGIAAGGAARAFDLFQRLDSRRDIAGTGVGLAICRWIADVHHGSISIDAACRQGLRIVITLPACEVPAASLSSAAPA